MRDLTIGPSFLASISTLPPDEKIRRLYLRLKDIPAQTMEDVATEVLKNNLIAEGEGALVAIVLAVDQTYTI